MAFADPASITINGSAKSLTRISSDGTSSKYYYRNGTTEQYVLDIRHTTFSDKSKVQRSRHNVQLVHTVFAVAPAIRDTVRKSYIVCEQDAGDDPAQLVYEASGLFTFLTASTNANLTKLTNVES